jgi:Flp pilus assembly protein TadD
MKRRFSRVVLEGPLRQTVLFLPLGILAFALSISLFTAGAEEGSVAPGKPAVTFNKDVAPIVYRRCSGCHRPEDAAPFSLLTYGQVSKRARQIADVTARGYMPPWPPAAGYGEFADERRLTETELDLVQRWVKEGALEGDPTDLQPPPEWPKGWKLGEPDLVVTMPQPYTLAAEGRDVYRNFVFPIPVQSNRFVRAVEFKPGNPRVVHHAFFDIDETSQSRRWASRENPPGFDGMELPDTAVMPAGQFLGWQPGKSVYQTPEGLAWVLRTNTDMVLQMHLHPSGKPEQVQSSIGFYFTDRAPTNLPFRLRLIYYELDIPPGATDYTVEESYILPVDVALLRVNPHAHYLGKDLQGYAVLPNGQTNWLLRIPDWDFNWQGDYQYKQPIDLPKGTRVVMRFSYDNSTNNIRNPHQPPVRVRHGINSTDEMAALGFQALTRNAEDRALLGRDYQRHLARVLASYFEFRLRNDPNDAPAHTRLASMLVFQGKGEEAFRHALAATRLQPEDAQARYQLGYLYLAQGRLKDARAEFEAVVRLDPRDYEAHGNLGFIAMQERRWKEAQAHFENALRANPDDAMAKKNLDLAKAKQARPQ